MQNPIPLMKHSAAKFMRDAAALIMESYEEYLMFERKKTDGYNPMEPKNFKAFHDAGKSAASHLDAVLKMSGNAESSQDTAKQKAIYNKEYDAVKTELRLLKKNER